MMSIPFTRFRLGRLQQYDPIPWTPPPAPPAPPIDLSFHLMMPVLNGRGTVGAAIQSILNQGMEDVFLCLRDGGSTDGSEQIYRELLPADHWVVREGEKQGQALAAGFSTRQGDIMGWLNADDLLLPGTLAKVGHVFVTRPDVDVIYGSRICIDESDREIGRWILPPHREDDLRWGDWVPQETLFWRRSLYDRVGGIDPGFDFAMDWDLLLRFQSAGARFEVIPDFLGAFRVHPGQKTSRLLQTSGRDEVHRLYRRELGRVPEKSERRKGAEAFRRRSRAEARKFLLQGKLTIRHLLP